jgi:hypothetical protein
VEIRISGYQRGLYSLPTLEKKIEYVVFRRNVIAIKKKKVFYS